VGVRIPSKHVTFAPIRSNASLAEWDIAVFRPVAQEFTRNAPGATGSPARLDERTSAEFRHAARHWHAQLQAALDLGRTVILFLPEPETLHLAREGDPTETETASSYDLAPVPADWTPEAGMNMTPGPGAAMLDSYWARFSAMSKYHVAWAEHPDRPALLTPRGHVVGFEAIHGASGGRLVVLPDLPFDDSSFIESDGENRPRWTQAAIDFAETLARELLLLADMAAAAPDWVDNPEFRLASEAGARAQIEELEERLRALQRDIANKRRDLSEASRLKDLMFAAGPRLDEAVVQALLALGFEPEATDIVASGLDTPFRCPEGRIFGAAEGTDNGPVGLSRLPQLTYRVLEDAERDEAEEPAKGVLFGNAHRLTPPALREACFSDKCARMATSTSLALLDTVTLFHAVQRQLETGDEDAARAFRSQLVASSGVVKANLLETPRAAATG
jgi:hypothetical protein